MKETAPKAETSAARAPQAAKPTAKGNQLEGPRSTTTNVKGAADILKASILGDGTAEGNNPAPKGETPAKNEKPKASEKSKKDQSKPQEVDEEADDEELDPDAEEGDEDEQSEDDGADEGQSDDEEGDGADDDADEDGKDLHTVLVDGEEMQIPYEELLLGYQRQSDYTKKTAELARDREALQSEKEQLADLPQMKANYIEQAQRFASHADLVLVAFEKGFMPQPPAEELRATNPAEYLLQKEKHQEALQLVASLQNERSEIAKRETADLARAVNEGRTKLLQLEPELQKPEVRGKFQQYVMGLGYTPDEIKTTPDPRLFQMAFKAMKWDDLIQRSKQPKPELKRSKVLKKGSARDTKDTIAERKTADITARHKREHNVKSASAVFAHKLRARQGGKR